MKKESVNIVVASEVKNNYYSMDSSREESDIELQMSHRLYRTLK